MTAHWGGPYGLVRPTIPTAALALRRTELSVSESAHDCVCDDQLWSGGALAHRLCDRFVCEVARPELLYFSWWSSQRLV
jgi:hypothetical protein